jgi:hypothetical protein
MVSKRIDGYSVTAKSCRCDEQAPFPLRALPAGRDSIERGVDSSLVPRLIENPPFGAIPRRLDAARGVLDPRSDLRLAAARSRPGSSFARAQRAALAPSGAASSQVGRGRIAGKYRETLVEYLTGRGAIAPKERLDT